MTKMKLSEELKACGCNLSEDAFRQLCSMAYDEMYGAMPDEQLLVMPDEAKRFAGIIRQRSKAPKMADSIPLRTVSNLRKSSRLKVAK
jgi:hypothetical protein